MTDEQKRDLRHDLAVSIRFMIHNNTPPHCVLLSQRSAQGLLEILENDESTCDGDSCPIHFPDEQQKYDPDKFFSAERGGNHA